MSHPGVPRRGIELRRHRVSHLPSLVVPGDVIALRFARGCATRNCDATCCRVGVWVDVAHRDLILTHAADVQRRIDPDQERDPSQWFGASELADADFPSGRAVGTRVRADRCVFLDGAGRCVLQATTLAAAGAVPELKPFFCAAFPLVILDGTLTIEDEFPNQVGCCSPTGGGEQTIFDVLGPELMYVLGGEGVEELRSLAAQEPG